MAEAYHKLLINRPVFQSRPLLRWGAWADWMATRPEKLTILVAGKLTILVSPEELVVL